MDDIKFSVVLPVYNVADYLRECLDSLINQTYSNLEIICVNDGSTDNSLAILQEYAAKDSRIKIINQENQGLGQTRTNGMPHATGDFISFIDPDDWIELDMFEKLAVYVKEKNPQVVQFNIRYYFESDKTFSQVDFLERYANRVKIDIKNKDYYCWKEMKNILIHGKSSACDKIYKLSFLRENNLVFPAHRYGEDVAFYRELLFAVDKIYLYHECFYNYRRRMGSLSNEKVKLNKTFLLEQIDMTRNILEKHGFMSQFKKEYTRYKLRFIYELERGTASEFKSEFMNKAKTYLSKREYMQLLCRKYIKAMARNIFKLEKRYAGTNKTQITVLGFSFQI